MRHKESPGGTEIWFRVQNPKTCPGAWNIFFNFQSFLNIVQYISIFLLMFIWVVSVISNSKPLKTWIYILCLAPPIVTSCINQITITHHTDESLPRLHLLRPYAQTKIIVVAKGMEWADWSNLKGRWSQLPQNHTDALIEIKSLLQRRKGAMDIGEAINNCSLCTKKENWNEQVLKII